MNWRVDFHPAFLVEFEELTPPVQDELAAMAHQGGVQHRHLDYYLDEFAFRFNRRRSKARGLLFHRLAQQAVALGPVTFDTITKQPTVLV